MSFADQRICCWSKTLLIKTFVDQQIFALSAKKNDQQELFDRKLFWSINCLIRKKLSIFGNSYLKIILSECRTNVFRLLVDRYEPFSDIRNQNVSRLNRVFFSNVYKFFQNCSFGRRFVDHQRRRKQKAFDRGGPVGHLDQMQRTVVQGGGVWEGFESCPPS